MQLRFRIQITILVSFLLVLIMTSGLIIVYNYQSTTREYFENLDEEIESTAATILDSTAQYVRPADITARFLAWTASRRSSILDHKDAFSDQAMKMLDLYPQIEGFFSGDRSGNLLAIKRASKGREFQYLKDRKLPTAALYEIRTINRTGSSISEFHEYKDSQGRTVAIEQRPPGGDYFDPRFRPWYRGAEETKKSYWSDPYVFLLSKQVGITAATPVFNAEGDVNIVVSADITMARISEAMKKYRIGKSGVTFLMTEEGELIGYPDDSVIQKRVNDRAVLANYKDTKNPVIIEAFRQFQQKGLLSQTIEHDGDPYIVRFKRIGQEIGKNWLLGFVVYLPELTAESDRVTRLMVLFSIIIVVAASLLIYIISRNISKPIERIAMDLEDIGNFKIDRSVPEDTYFLEIFRMNSALENMKRSLRDFSRFVPKAVVRKLIKSESGAEIGGTKRNITLMFTDIKGFTSLSEKMTSERLIRHLSEYLNELTYIIQENQGTIDKYIGDAIMCFWGAPEADDAHPINACYAAYQCKVRLEELNHMWKLDGKPPLYTRIGVHTGDAIVGNVGSEDRLNYSAFGDNVNTASRLEGVNKAYGTQILLSHPTYVRARQSFIFRPVDVVLALGKSEPIKIYELLCPLSEDPKDKFEQEEMQTLSDLTQTAFDAYLEQDWKTAEKTYLAILKSYANDTVSEVMLARIHEYKKTPPGENWDGVHQFSSK